MALDLEKIPFGLADIIVTKPDGETIRFDGVDELQAEGGEVVLTPELEGIVIADYGTGNYDERVVGYTGSVTIVAAQESLRVLELAIASAETITETVGGDVVGLMDAPIGSSMRKKAARVTIHPRHLPDTDKSQDITLYKAASTGDFTRAQANSQGNIPITMSMYPRDGMDPSKPGNFYYIGGTDPNPVVPAG